MGLIKEKMQDQSRVLGYHQTQILSESDLRSIAGGTAKKSVEHTQKVTGSAPGTTDVELDQIWD